MFIMVFHKSLNLDRLKNHTLGDAKSSAIHLNNYFIASLLSYDHLVGKLKLSKSMVALFKQCNNYRSLSTVFFFFLIIKIEFLVCLTPYLPDHICRGLRMQHMTTKLCHNYKLTKGMCVFRFWRVSVLYTLFLLLILMVMVVFFMYQSHTCMLIFWIDTFVLGATKINSVEFNISSEV